MQPSSPADGSLLERKVAWRPAASRPLSEVAPGDTMTQFRATNCELPRQLRICFMQMMGQIKRFQQSEGSGDLMLTARLCK